MAISIFVISGRDPLPNNLAIKPYEREERFYRLGDLRGVTSSAVDRGAAVLA